MATIKSEVQTAQALTVTGLSTLNPSTNLYVVSSAINHSTNDPLDVILDVSVASTNVVAGNKQLVIFAKGSIDGTNFGSGPESGTATGDESDLHFVGVVPLNTSSTTHRKLFSLAAAYGGVLPLQSKIVFKNDLGVALTSGTVQYSEVWGVSV